MAIEFSISRYTTFKNCAFQYYSKYVLNIAQETTPHYFAFGTATEKAFSFALQNLKVKEDEILEEYEKSWEDSMGGDYFSGNWNSKQKEKFENGKIIIPALKRKAEDFREEGIKFISEQDEVKETFQNVDFKGYLDLLLKKENSQLFIGEIKTASRKWSLNEEKGKLQPVFYPWYLFQADPDLDKVLFKYMIFTLTKKPDIQEIDMIITKEHSSRMMIALAKEIETIYNFTKKNEKEPGAFLPTRSFFGCNPDGCLAWKICKEQFKW